MSQSPQAALPPGTGVWRRSTGVSGWGRARAVTQNCAGGPYSEESGAQALPSTFPPKSCALVWGCAPVEVGCLLLMHRCHRWLYESTPPQECLLCWPCPRPVRSPAHVCGTCVTAGSSDLGCKGTSAGKRLVTIVSKMRAKATCHSE